MVKLKWSNSAAAVFKIFQFQNPNYKTYKKFKMHFKNYLQSFLFLFNLHTATLEPLTTTPHLPSMEGVLDHVVIYQPLPPSPEYKR